MYRRNALRRIAALGMAGFAALLLSGCANSDTPDGDDQSEVTPSEVTQSGAAHLQIVATPWPLAWLTQEIAPDADIRTLGSAGQDPHDLDLSPDERAALQSADMVVYLGQIHFQPQVEQAIDGADTRVVAVAEVAPDRLRTPDGEIDPTVEADPHLWLDPTAMARTSIAVGEALAAADPAQADAYRQRATQTAQTFATLQAELAEAFTSCAQDVVVVSHAAYGYVVQGHAIEQIGISGAGGHSEVSSSRLAQLATLIREKNVTAVLAEEVEGRAAAQALAREAEVALVDVDPLESPSQAQRQQGFPALFRQLVQTFADTLKCHT